MRFLSDDGVRRTKINNQREIIVKYQLEKNVN